MFVSEARLWYHKILFLPIFSPPSRAPHIHHSVCQMNCMGMHDVILCGIQTQYLIWNIWIWISSGGGLVNSMRHFCRSIIARVLIYRIYWAQVFHVEICRRALIPKFKKTKNKIKIFCINIDSVYCSLVPIYARSSYSYCFTEFHPHLVITVCSPTFALSVEPLWQ